MAAACQAWLCLICFIPLFPAHLVLLLFSPLKFYFVHTCQFFLPSLFSHLMPPFMPYYDRRIFVMIKCGRQNHSEKDSLGKKFEFGTSHYVVALIQNTLLFCSGLSSSTSLEHKTACKIIDWLMTTHVEISHSHINSHYLYLWNVYISYLDTFPEHIHTVSLICAVLFNVLDSSVKFGVYYISQLLYLCFFCTSYILISVLQLASLPAQWQQSFHLIFSSN